MKIVLKSFYPLIINLIIQVLLAQVTYWSWKLLLAWACIDLVVLIFSLYSYMRWKEIEEIDIRLAEMRRRTKANLN